MMPVRAVTGKTSPSPGSDRFGFVGRKAGFAAVWEKSGPPDLCRKDANGDYRCK
jgi:hypothetical protein